MYTVVVRIFQTMESQCVDTKGWRELVDSIIFDKPDEIEWSIRDRFEKFLFNKPDEPNKKSSGMISIQCISKVQEVVKDYSRAQKIYNLKHKILKEEHAVVVDGCKFPDKRISKAFVPSFRWVINRDGHYIEFKFNDVVSDGLNIMRFDIWDGDGDTRRLFIMNNSNVTPEDALVALFESYEYYIHEVKEIDADLELIQSIKEHIGAYSGLGKN